MSALGGVEVVGVAVVLVGGLGLAAAAAAAMVGVAAVAGTGYVAYHGVRLGARGAAIAGELAAEGARTAVAAGSALVTATEQAVVQEVARQARAYEDRFATAQQETSAAIAALQARLGQERRANRVAAGPVPAPGTDPALEALVHQSEALLASPAAREAARPTELAARIAEALVLCQTHGGSPLTAPLRQALAEATAAGTDASPAHIQGLAHRLEALGEAVRERLATARRELAPLLAQVAARMELLELGASQYQGGGAPGEGQAELEAWRTRFRAAEAAALTTPDLAIQPLRTLLADLDALLAAGRQDLGRRQQDTVAAALLKTLIAQGYQVVSDGAHGEDRRIAVSHLGEQRRVVFKIGPGGQLVFDVLDGHHGESCLKLLEAVWAGMEREGVVFGGPPRLEQLDEMLSRVGLGVLAEKYRFLVSEPDAADPAATRDRSDERLRG